tara:strand:+ start:242 stop:559 length:318 start_codon:yes stop_codon:yes gene_type:complete
MSNKIATNNLANDKINNDKIKQYNREAQAKFIINHPDYYKQQYKQQSEYRKQKAKEKYQAKKNQKKNNTPIKSFTDRNLDTFAELFCNANQDNIVSFIIPNIKLV